ncbi:hypothetical protein ACIGO9_31745 [Nocardia asteroides]|uniref:hypothetical protein n=1 Tax=Nocardia asteroides TaxID=1824 RepID=UPI0037C8BF0B
MVHNSPVTKPPTERIWNCSEDPGELTNPSDVAAVDRVHGRHGPECLPAIAAFAHISDGTEY